MSTLFEHLNLIEPLQRALREKNYSIPSPIQAQAIPHLLEGRDVLGCAQTGTGKTAAFALPILQHLSNVVKPSAPRTPRALILTPTRELASQIAASFQAYGKFLKLTHTVIFGGVGAHPQIKAMQRGVDIVVATPGRLLDLMGQGHVRLDKVEFFVLDEADRMLDMGFINDIRKIAKTLPAQRQSLLFSATMPAEILGLAESFLKNPVRVEVTPVASTAERIEQKICFVEKSKKRELLLHLLQQHGQGLTLIFSRTKHGANRIAEGLGKDGYPAEAIHGNKSQGARERALENFRRGKSKVLVATDIAARGIDVKGITFVVNYDVPVEAESYVHRIGRTARAGAEGLAITLCDGEERKLLRDIERLIQQSIPVLKEQPFHNESAGQSTQRPGSAGGNQRFQRGGRSGGRPQFHKRGPSRSPAQGSGGSGARRTFSSHSSSRG